jgi:hypothetical protein
MCTNVCIHADVEGSAKGPHGWFRIDTAEVSFDHPQHASFEHSLNIDFVSRAAGDSRRVAVELSAAAARELAEGILRALHLGEAEVAGAGAAG